MPRTLVALYSLILFSLTLPAVVAAQNLPRITTIDGDRVHTILPPDAIRAIDRPKFVGADEARFMKDEELVVGVVHNGIAKAYSLWHLDSHEIVNDDFGPDPLAVTW